MVLDRDFLLWYRCPSAITQHIKMRRLNSKVMILLSFIYSDCITDQKNPKKEEYGKENLKQMMLNSVDLFPLEIQQKILADFETHLEGKPAGNGIKVIVIKAIYLNY
ncbi:TPA: hypothetical protein EYO57_09480 [Candidatus Poribacteria bacterium]|nr:hypothetical protein [Candidatus Poribacteria bacterium]